MQKYEFKKLLFRRQFIFGPSFVDYLQGWNRMNIGSQYCLTIHPELMAYQNAKEGKSLSLLGFILDPANPEKSNAEIVDKLMEQLIDEEPLDKIICQTYPMGGRWVLIMQNKEEIRFVNDPLGFRQLYFFKQKGYAPIWVASQTGILSEVLNLQPDKNVLRQLFDCYEKKDGEYWWPNDLTPYNEIKRVLPNHYLTIPNGSCTRYWPKKKYTPISLEDGVNRASNLLKGIIKSASNRYELAYTLTAGRDSRLNMAASRDIKDKIYFFTLMYWKMDKKSRDIIIAKKILKKLGLRHHLIECPEKMDEEFNKIYMRNVPTAREVYGTIAQGLYNQFPAEKICVKGNASAVIKHRGIESEHSNKLDGMALAKWVYMGQNGLAANEFNKWLDYTENKLFNFDLLSIFYWEQRLGSWQGMSQTEWDIVQEVFNPCNCRDFLETCLAIPEEFRKGPKYILFDELMKNLWKEVLSEAINPEWKKYSEKTMEVLMKTKIHKLVPKPIRGKIKKIFLR